MNINEAFIKACQNQTRYVGTVPNLIVDWEEIGKDTQVLVNAHPTDDDFWQAFDLLVDQSKNSPLAQAILWEPST